MLDIWGSKPQQEKAVAEFLSGSDVFVNFPTGYGKPLIYHMASLVIGDCSLLRRGSKGFFRVGWIR